MEEQEMPENPVIEKDLLLETSNILGNDSNSLEPGEVVEEKTPQRQLPDAEDESKFNTPAEADNTVGSGCNTITPSKPVLGKEKAKQKLKALGIQKKIQMESKNIRLPQKRKNSRDKSVNTPKKDKPPTPHEKAKLTKEEIEKMKEKQDCAIPCLYYDEAMIHHIRADCSEEKSFTNKVEPCLTASLEAIKNYDDQDEAPVAGGTAVAAVGNTSPAFKRRRYTEDNIRNYKQTRRKLFHPEEDIFSSRMRDKGTKRLGLSRERLMKSSYRTLELRLQNRRRLSEQSKVENKSKPFELLRDLPLCQEDGLMYTKTKPPLSFAFHTDAGSLHTKQLLSERRYKRSKKKSKDHRELDEDGSKKRARLKQSRHDMDPRRSSKKRSNKKRVAGNRSEKKAKKGKRSKSRKRRKKLAQSGGGLSFHLNEFYPEEDTEGFPLCKDGVTAVDEVEEDDLTLENKLKSLQEELNKKSPSPDTDDYMANWEEEEDFVPIPRSKDTTPVVAVVGTLGSLDQEAQERKQITSESDGCTKEEDEDEIRDGLGTPIFVNPSPPAELLATVMQNEQRSSPNKASERKASPLGAVTDNIQRSRAYSSPLFGMQVIYEQFIQSVNEAGIELSLEQRHPKEDGDPPASWCPNEDNSFTPNTSPGKSFVAPSESEASYLCSELLGVAKCASESVSSTPSPSHSDSSSSSSSSTASSNEDYDKTMEAAPVLEPQLSMLSPEDSKKLHSLQKRWRMLKTLQEQSDAMDDEDIQCLLGLEKLIEAEKSLLMRKYELSEKNEVAVEDEKEEDTLDARRPLKDDSEMYGDLSKIFDANREAVKLTISPKVQKPVPKVSPAMKRSDEEDDQDFTEKLMKSSREISEKDEDSHEDKESRTRNRSLLRTSRSPESRRGVIRKGRSLSVSPVRRSRNQVDRSRRSKRRQYSPLARHFRLDSPISRKRHELRRSRERKRSLSPLIRRRSRSPYSRRFSRSPPFRPPSPKSPPPMLRGSRSPSKEHTPCLENPPGSTHHYLWSDEQPLHFYSGYYYPPSSPNHIPGNQLRPYSSGLTYSNYTQYSTYPGDYTENTSYANNYGNEYIGSEPMDSYSRIPVINSTGANYYYNEFEGVEPEQRQSMPTGNGTSRQQGEPGIKSSTFAVQKGNVLEIVPSPVMPKPQEPVFTETANEPQCGVESSKGGTEDCKEKEEQQPQMKKEKAEEKRKKRRSGELLSWEDEVAKRHIMSAVLRLNKEGDSTLRGILRNKTNPDVQPKEKKKVLFADGIPPGKNSCTSDEDSPPSSSTRKRSRKKRRRGENKENEETVLSDLHTLNEIKVDPELENAPPPPPPPGSPPANLEQPVLIRPPSPEQLLYFHYDGVVNSMYVSQLATPIPPRLLNRGIPQIPPPVTGNTPKGNIGNAAVSMENEVIKETFKEESKDTTIKEIVHLEGPAGYPKESNNEPSSIIKQELNSESKTADMAQPETAVVPEPHSTRPYSPLVQLPSENSSSMARSFTPPPVKNQMFAQVLGDSRPLSPAIPSFTGFNRPPPRPTVGVLRPDFSIPPPSAQMQTMLSHPSIPFGPRPPGGSPNFNRNVPPPFNPPQQHRFATQGMSPSQYPTNCDVSHSPGSNVMQSSVPTQSMPAFRSPSFSNTTTGYASSPAPPVRGPGMCSSFRSPGSFDNSSVQYSPVGVKQSLTSIMGKPPQFHGNNKPPLHQYHQNNNSPTLLNSPTAISNFNTSPAPHNVRPPPPHPFSSSGMLSQMHHHRPNLGFPRSFGPPRPPPPPQHGSPHQHHMYGGQPPPMALPTIIPTNQMPANIPPFASAPRSLYPSAGNLHHFLRMDANGQRVPPNSAASAPPQQSQQPQHQQQQQQQQALSHPPSPSSSIGRTPNNNSL